MKTSEIENEIAMITLKNLKSIRRLKAKELKKERLKQEEMEANERKNREEYSKMKHLSTVRPKSGLLNLFGLLPTFSDAELHAMAGRLE